MGQTRSGSSSYNFDNFDLKHSASVLDNASVWDGATVLAPRHSSPRRSSPRHIVNFAIFCYDQCCLGKCHCVECLLFVIKLNVRMRSVIKHFGHHYCVEYHYAECHYAECHYAECHFAEWCYAEWRHYSDIMLSGIMLVTLCW